MPRFVVPVQQRPGRDGTTPTSRHVPFYLAIEAASDVWQLALQQYCVPEIVPMDLAMVHVSSDFRRELFTGELTVDVEVRRIGTTSFTVGLALEQDDDDAGECEFVFALVDASRTAAIAISPAQRAVLEKMTR
ncbi:acyl-CoA thioesterase [Petropleomorpha daqingensis]|uniref:Acyl-CoA thioesterase FadM n=1 Tax=Petropleomorpha daqingensis TaxID=2026353 RepID=A0A853CBF7_9ACTN|nr:acyl-CoA thioesterase FadM [Petropleomorpha daqingensis]